MSTQNTLNRRARVLAQAVSSCGPKHVENLEARQLLSLVLQWNFDAGNGSTVADTSGNFRDGTIPQDAWNIYWDANGKVNGAIKFDSAGAPTVGAISTNSTLSDVLENTGSLAVWIKTTAAGNDSFWLTGAITGLEQSGAGNDIAWGWLDAAGRISLAVSNDGAIKSLSPVNDGQWHHVAMTRNAATGDVKLYVDGYLNASAKFSTGTMNGVPGPTGFSSIGALTQTNGTFTYFEGSLDELNVYDHVLSDAEVAGLYDPTHQPPSAATGLSVAGAGTTAIKLTWTNTATNASSYIIERSPDGSTWAPVAQIAISQSYVDRGLTPNTAYYYRVKAANYFGTAAPTNTVSATTIPVAAEGNGTGLLGLYYDNGGQTNPTVNTSLLYTGLVITRVDPVVNFSWGAGAPDSRMGVDQFSVKWVGEVQAQYSEFYTFYTQTDDGAFLFIDLNDGFGLQKIIDDPTYHGAAGNEKSSEALKPGGIQLVAGQKYKIMMGMFEDGGDAAAQLRWESLSTPKDIIPKSQLFPGSFTAAPSPASGLSAAPATGFAGANNIILNWTEGTDAIGYRLFRAESGAGPWLEIGRVGGSTFTDLVYPGKTYYYKLVAFNTAGESSESNVATATSTSLPTGTAGLLGMYWDNRNMVGAPLAVRVDVQQLDSANGGAPVPNTGVIEWPDIDGTPNLATGIGTIDDGNNFSVRWQGTFIPPTNGNYTFWTRTDDDVRFYIAGNRQIAAPNAGNFNAGRGAPGAPGDSSGAIYLQAGRSYPIMMEYNQGTGGARAELRWQGPSIAQALMPAIRNSVPLVTPAIVPVVTPTGVQATVGSGAVGLTWTDASMSEQGFYVEVSTDGGTTWARYATVGQAWNSNPTSGTPSPTSTVRYMVGGLQPNTAYSFRVKSFNIGGESTASDVVSVTTSQLSTDPAVSYPFSESSGNTTKDSTDTFTANLTGNTRFTTRGRAGNAVLFDESGHVDAGNLAQFNPTSQLTLAAWFNATDWNGNRRIIQKGNGDNQYRLLVENVTINNVTTKYLRFHIANVGEVLAPLPSTGVWHHVAATYDGASMKIYLDGALAASNTASGNIPVTQDNLFIGTKGGTTVRGDRFLGKIDDVRIYDTAIDLAAVQALAVETPVAAPTNLQVTVPAGDAGRFSLSLAWTDNSTQNYPSFKVLRSTNPADASSWRQIAVVDGTSFTDSSVFANMTYSYKVVAINTLGEAESNVASGTTASVGAAGALTATSNTLSGTVNLSAAGVADWAHPGATGVETASHVTPGGAVITQGADYVAWEAEDGFWATDPDLDGRTGRVVDGTTTPPANGPATTASAGRALLLDEGPNPKRGQAFVNWNIKVTEPGYYRLYARRRNFDIEGNGGVGENDSILIPRLMNVPAEGSSQYHLEWQYGGDTNYGWSNSGTDYFIASPGMYTFPVGPREGGSVLDRLVLARHSALSAAELDALANSPIAGQVNLSLIGNAAPAPVNGPATFTWNDGTMAATGSTTEGLSVTGAGNGFRVTVPAFGYNRKLRVYVGAGANSTAAVVARLSDGSAAPYTATIDNSAGGSVVGRVYEFDFKSGIAGQTLDVELTSVSGSVALFGAVWTETAAPAAPTGLKAIPVSRTDVSLAWNDNSNNETGFRIERSTDGATWSTAAIVGANTTTYTELNSASNAMFRVIAFNATGSSAASNTVNAVLLRDPTGPWQTKDIGAVGVIGDGAIDPASGVARLTGSGSDIWDVGTPNVGDQFRFLYQQVTGDFTITAHVLPFDRWNDAGTDVNAWVKAGVMVRQLVDDQSATVTAGLSPMVDMIVSSENNVHTQWRQVQDGAGRNDPNNNLYSRSGWVRLQRQGGMIYSFWSEDGVNWNPGLQAALSSAAPNYNNQQIALPDTVYVGLAVTSHDNANLASVLFSDVSLDVTPPAAPAAPSGLVAVPITNNGVVLSWADNSNNETQFVIERNDGSGTWTEIGRTDVNVKNYVDKTALTTGQQYTYRVKAARYTNLSASTAEVAVTATAGEALPAGWTAANLTTTQPNVYGYNTAADTIDATVSGGDHWGTADSIGYIYKAANGDFSITTKVNSQEITGQWAKAGIAIRETADPNAKAVSLVVTPSNGLQFMWRDTVGGSTAGIYMYEVDRRYSGLTGNFVAPIYLRLTRVGNDIIGYFSQDGTNWTQYGKHTLAMAADVTAGVTQTSNNASGAAATATFTGSTVGAAQVIDGTSNTINLTSFPDADGLTLTGWSYIADNKLVLVPNGQNIRGSAFTTTPRDVRKFNVSFDFQVPRSATADGFAFVIQGQSPRFIGATGGSLGYAGYTWSNQNAMAIKFDVYNNIDQTGLYINNSMNDSGLDLRPSGIDLDSGRRYHVAISVDGSTITQTITDVLAPQNTFTTSYTVMLSNAAVDLPTLLGSQYGYIGFTAGNGGLSTQPQILNFSYEAQAITPPSINIVGNATAETWYVKRDGNDVKVWNNADGSGAPAQTVPFATMTDFNINGGGEADTLVLDLTGGALFPATGLNVAGGTVKLQLVGGDSVTLPAIQLAAGASLDLGTNDLIIQNATYANIAPLVASARAGTPRWTGPGIGTSSANADQGLALDQVGSDVKIKFTWNGDLNLDGRVNADDYFYIDQGFLQKPTPPKYHDGDFNFDGKINADDYFLIDQAFLNQKGQILSAPKPALAETVTASKKTAARAGVFSSLKVRKARRLAVKLHRR